MLLKDRVAIITGGAGINGLGFATARQMAAQGARVAILDLERADPAGAAARLGDGHLGLVADVTDKPSCEAAAAAVLRAFGRIDALVNNAGITQAVGTLEIGGADYDRVLKQRNSLLKTARAAGRSQASVTDTLAVWDAPSAEWARALDAEFDAVVDALAARREPAVLVSNEVGLGLVAPHRSGRIFADSLGRLNQRVAAVCDRVVLVVAGQSLVIK